MTHCDVAVIGAGPAGLSAAVQLGEAGADTIVLDEKPAAGGQLFKQIHKFFGSERHMAGMRGFEIGELLLSRCEELQIPVRLNSPAWALFPDLSLGTTFEGLPSAIKAKQVIVATGASENALSFPGWTLPGVMGAGAVQTMVNYHRVRPGERALVVGAGNVGLIVAYQLLQAGIEVVAVAEAAHTVGGYMVHAAKIRRMGVPFAMNHTVLSAEGEGRVERCTIAAVDEAFVPQPGTERTFDVDLVCVAVGLSPAVELCSSMGMEMTHVGELGGWIPSHNAALQTSIDGVYVAGDVSGVEEASSAMEEGRLAALSALSALGVVRRPEAECLRTKIKESLNQLRRGPFGSTLAQRKEDVCRRHEEQCLTIA
ncbi:MAG: FAD-dependent oxidoreductase [Lentisphaerae bacterium]|nr:FAD-dependent oxidoreductase [Lentisphaerota bacterium]MBT4823244.1 FAD-dependent oxidoreductase [Lentisphaerota bacterium]MBT5604804.1 FAD-dependent oxidoreductase [Lentisphaerota bacterium]MBT7053555.1 FAD-dependent oxidoreductase [Lentisphaerota bacterium]MBT7843392.1 FAD-dependent oxidoreductase [Lentisphaerota bacterium]